MEGNKYNEEKWSKMYRNYCYLKCSGERSHIWGDDIWMGHKNIWENILGDGKSKDRELEVGLLGIFGKGQEGIVARVEWAKGRVGGQ